MKQNWMYLKECLKIILSPFFLLLFSLLTAARCLVNLPGMADTRNQHSLLSNRYTGRFNAVTTSDVISEMQPKKFWADTEFTRYMKEDPTDSNTDPCDWRSNNYKVTHKHMCISATSVPSESY